MLADDTQGGVYGDMQQRHIKHGQPFMQRLSVFLIYPVTSEVPISIPACIYKMPAHETFI